MSGCKRFSAMWWPDKGTYNYLRQPAISPVTAYTSLCKVVYHQQTWKHQVVFNQNFKHIISQHWRLCCNRQMLGQTAPCYHFIKETAVLQISLAVGRKLTTTASRSGGTASCHCTTTGYSDCLRGGSWDNVHFYCITLSWLNWQLRSSTELLITITSEQPRD